MAQGQEVEEVLVRDEGQGPLHIQGFRGKEESIYTYSSTGFIYNKIDLLYYMHIIKGILISFKKKYLHVHDYCILQQLLVRLRKALVEICCKKYKSQCCTDLMQLFN